MTTHDPVALRWEMREAGLTVRAFVTLMEARHLTVSVDTLTNWRRQEKPMVRRTEILNELVAELAMRRGVFVSEMKRRLKWRYV